jgi:hypothetical protein
MKYSVALVCVGVMFTLGMQGRSDSPPADRTLQNDRDLDLMNERWWAKLASDKPDCDHTYPLPQNYENWTHCRKDGGGSACGGPDQCAGLESQRLVTFTCDQGSYHQCYGEKGNGCKGN